ncbi:Protein of unknown function [Bacillus mycoides]|uniref:Uncharacterized protein n=1 Tax=Bacillus mycoides TaxID=1405 RepID=A0A1G4EGH4_BACMY|nr:Protein of unknown function [Bacillus mycoides]
MFYLGVAIGMKFGTSTAPEL